MKLFFLSAAKRWPVFLFCCLLPGLATARTFTMRTFTDQDGLPQNSVGAIVVDKDHYTWVVTQDGFARFDGNLFVTYNKSNVPGLVSNRFAGFRYDRAGNLYAFNEANQYIRLKSNRVVLDTGFRRRHIGFGAVLGNEEEGPHWIRGNVGDGTEIMSGREYCYLDSTGYGFLYNGREVSFLVDGRAAGSISFGGKRIRRYFVLDRTLHYLQPDGSLLQIRSGRISSMKLTGAICLDPYYRQYPDSMVVFWNALDQAPLIYCNGNFYLLRQDSGQQVHTSLLYAQVPIKPNWITSVYYEAAAKRLFIGSAINGLSVLSEQKFTVLGSNAIGGHNVYYAHIPYAHQQLLTGDGLLLPLTQGGSGFKAIPEGKDAYGILQDRKGYIWRKDLDRVRLYDYSLRLLQEWTYPSDVTDIVAASGEGVWVGSGRSGGLLSHIRPGRQVKPWLVFRSSISYMQQQHPDSLWIGTGDGLFLLRLPGKELYEIPELKGKYIRSLYLRQPGELWITTYEDGLFYYNGRDVVNLPEDRNNFLKTAHCIVEDSFGYFWISTNKGLFQAARRDLLAYADARQDYVYYQYYNRRDGFITNEFNGGCQPCGTRWADGFISFPSLNGIVRFDPSVFPAEQPDAAIHIDQVLVDKQVYPLAGNTLELPRHFEQLRIQLSTPYYGNPENVQMQYALLRKDVHTQWYEVSNNEIVFPHMEHGYYVLKLRKMNGFGPENETSLEFRFYIPPPFYEAWWFYGIVSLFLLFAVYVYIRLRLRYVVQRNRGLELEVARRTKSMRQALTRLTESENQLRRQHQLQEKIVAAIGHDVKSPLKFIALANQKAAESIDAGDPARARYISLESFKAANRTYHHISNFVAYVKAQMQQGSIVMEAVNLQPLVLEKEEIFLPIAAAKSMLIHNEVAADLVVQTSSQLLSVVVHNLLDNAIKYGNSGAVRIKAWRAGDGMSVLCISDEGSGIDQATAAWLSGEADIPGDPVKGGLGLLMVKEICALLRISLTVSNTMGTAICLYFQPA